MSRKIYTIPAGFSFADELARTVMEKAGGDPLALSRFLILLPSRRSCRTLRDAFLRLSQGKPTVLPRLQPLGDVDADELSLAFSAASDEALEIPPAISPLRRQVILARTVMKLYESVLPAAQRPRFDQAVQLAAELARFLDQVQTEQVSFDRLETLVPEEFAAHWQITLDFLKILTQNWPDILNEMGVIDPAERRNRLLRAQAQLWRDAPPDTPVIAAGSIASVPATLDLLEVIADMPQGEIILPGLDRHLDEESWQMISADHPQYFIKKLLDKLDMQRADVCPLVDSEDAQNTERFFSEIMRPAETTGRWRELSNAPVQEQLNVITCKTQQDEAETIAVIMRETLEMPDRTAALITPNRDLARRVSGALRRWGIEVDDSAGRCLHQTPKGGWALAVGEMLRDEFAPVAFLNALKTPLFRLGDKRGLIENYIAEIETRALRGIRPEAGLDGLTARLKQVEADSKKPVTPDVYEFLQRLQEATEFDRDEQNFSTHIKTHIRILESLAAGEEDSGAERLWMDEDGEALSLFFAELLQLSADLPKLDFAGYLQVIKQLLSQKTVRPKFGTHPRLFILGQIEARLYVADTIIIGGLNEGHWPPNVLGDPWMSRQMRADFGLPATEQTIGIAAHDFTQLASAGRVFLTRAGREAGAPTVPSRWLLRMETVLAAMGMELSDHAALSYHSWRETLDKPEKIVPLKRPAPCPPAAARPKGLSVTGMERLMRDPYEVYARYILKLRALDPLDADPAAAERGQLLHAILEKFVSKYPDDLPPDAQQVLLDMGRQEFTARAIPPEIESFWWPRFERLVHAYLAEEFSWRRFAKPLKTEVKGRINLDGFELSAIADRIDRIGDKAAIIDYKTGTTPGKAEIEGGFSPQLWLEALILSAGGFNDIPASEVAWLGFWVVGGGHSSKMNQEIKCDDHAAVLAETDAGVRRVLAAFDKKETPYIARPNSNFTPAYSDYTHFERVQEWVYDEDIDISEVGT